MLKVGLTGGIGSGKSTIARIFELLGVPVYNADEAAKRLMNTDENLKKALIEHFGESIYKNGELDRKYLASIVFNNKEKLQLLNSLTHPVTIRNANEWMQRQKAAYVIKEAALLFESAANTHLDVVVGVYAPAHIRIKRVMDRNGLSAEEVIKRMSWQMDEEIKMKMCDFVIYNNEEQLVIPQVLELHRRFLTGELPG